MNYLDIIILIPLCWGGIKGIKNGLIIEAASLIALALGIYGAIEFSNITAGWLGSSAKIEESYLPIIAFAVTFIAIVGLTHLVAKVLDTIISAVALGLVNKVAGVAFGVIKYGCIVSILALLIDKFNTTLQFMDPVMAEESILFYPLINIANYLWANLPF